MKSSLKPVTVINIKLLPGGTMPTKGSEGAAAYDCYANENISVGIFPVRISLGFCLELPDGYHAEIFPRSSIGLRTTLRQPNSVGIIDSDYRGEVKAIYEIKPYFGDYEIKKGQKIAQMIIKKNEEVQFKAVDELSDTERGSKGFGSTGN